MFSPAVETDWTDEHLNLRVVLPGVSEKDRKVSVQGNTLVVEGQRQPPEDFGKEGYVYTYMPHGRLERTIACPTAWIWTN